jgi:hypothetical protein
MLDDGVKERGADERVAVKDLAEILLEVSRPAAPTAPTASTDQPA